MSKSTTVISYFPVTLAIAISTVAGPALAQSEMNEIIVTGSRISDYYDNDVVPVVHIERRADFMVVNAFIESDSRDAKLRSREVSQTMKALERTAKSAPAIELGLLKSFETSEREIEYIVEFDEDDVTISRGSRPDTTRVAIVIKTPISDGDDSPEEVYDRIDDFIDSVPVTGRATVSDYGEPGFSLVNIAQYRSPLLKLLAEDARALKTVFGDEYKVHIAGLEAPVRWQAVGPMQLAIYFPYMTSASPD